MLHAPAMSAGRGKFDMESGESSMGTDARVVKGRDFRRSTENGGSWSVTVFDKFVGAPWEPYPRATR